MRFLFATGGTAGHINPALAVASYIKEQYPDSEILFIGTADHMEARLVPNAGFDFKTIKINGFKRSLSPKAIAANIKTIIIKSLNCSKNFTNSDFFFWACSSFNPYFANFLFICS